MDRLRIGIFPNANGNTTMGGEFSYYNTLAEAIGGHGFDPALDVKFIRFGFGASDSSANNVLQINPYKGLNRGSKFAKRLNTAVVQPAQNLVGTLDRLSKKLDAAFGLAYHRAVETELITNKVDLVYYPVPQANKLNYPFVSTHWDVGHRSMFCFPEVAMGDRLVGREGYLRNTLEKAFGVFCESEAGKAELIQYSNINSERIFVIPLFAGKVVTFNVPLQAQLRLLASHGLSAKAYFFYPAQFWSHKNHYNLLLAFEKLVEQRPGVKMIFTGSDKGNRDYISEVIENLGLRDRVVMPGFVSNEEIFSLYKNALALVMPTFLGPTNMPLLEAEALGCPVVCTDIPGHREMLGENAYYVRPEDPESIYQGMLSHLEASLQTVPRRNAVFNVANAVKQIEAAFLQLKSRRKAFGYNYNQV